MMLPDVKSFWSHLVGWFHDSETILWARLQAALGVVAAIVTYVDPAVLEPILPPAWVPFLLVANGVFTEYLRRRREAGM